MMQPRAREAVTALPPDTLEKVRAVLRLTPAHWSECVGQVALLDAALRRASPAQRRALRRTALRGLVQERVARETGLSVAIYHNAEAGIDAGEPSLAFFVVCVEHGFCVGVETLSTARTEAAGPTRWCEACRDKVAERRGDRCG